MASGNFNHFPQAITGLRTAMDQGVRKAAFDIQAHAAAIAPVDTGHMRNSIYTVTSKGSSYNASEPDDLPELGGLGPFEAWVAVAAYYGIYVEMGTRHMPPQPFLAPAADVISSTIPEYFSRVEATMQAAGV